MSSINRFIFIVLITVSCLSVKAQKTTWTLEDCINYALRENIQVKQAELGQKQSELLYEEAKAAMLPSAQAGASYNLGWSRSLDSDNNKYGNFEANNSTSFSLSSNLTVYNGLKLRNQKKQSNLNLQSNEYYTEVVKESVELSILNGFLQVLYAEESVENAEKQIELTKEQLILAEERLALSVISQSDFYQIKSELANEKLTLANAQSDLIIAKLNLMQLMELPVSNEFMVVSPDISSMLNENRMLHVTDIYNTALEIKPEVKQAKLNEESAVLDEKIARASLYPSLSLNAGVGTNYTVENGNYSYVEILSNPSSCACS